MLRNLPLAATLALLCFAPSASANAQSSIPAPLISFVRPAAASRGEFPIVANRQAAAIYIAPGNPETVRVVAQAFASDVERVTGVKPRILTTLAAPLPPDLILVGVLGHSPQIDRLAAAHTIDAREVTGKWESAVTTVVASPMPGVRSALVVAGSDRRGAAYALFTLSRQMGVSPWVWWADVPVRHHADVYVRRVSRVQPPPSVQYRGIFLNDEDWGLRPWASKKMDPTVDHGKGNIGPNTYVRVFELLLRLHANSLWPAMHRGTLPFNDVPENAKLADQWGIVMGSSHTEQLLRDNPGEWDRKTDGPWDFQTNSAAMIKYWDQRLITNGKYENFYTVGLRGMGDSGMEATGSPEVKAKLLGDVIAVQRKLLAKRVNPDLDKVPQVLWLYKESLNLYRVGINIPDDVTLGWTDDNYGYIRELPDAAEQARSGGSGMYYHVSYWGSPHDYLWLCTTPPALIQEEMTKAYNHHVRKYWILNVGDLKPAELDIDYFMQLATDEPAMAKMSQREFLRRWAAEQFPAADAPAIAKVLARYYALNFIRKPEFMGFNGNNDGIKRTAFNPLAWPSDGQPDQNHARSAAWARLRTDEESIGKTLPPQYAAAFFELVGYPVEGSAAMNDKLLSNDLTFLDAHDHNATALAADTANVRAAYDTIQTLTAKYNSLEDGKWDGIMSDAPRARHVFDMPRTATAADADTPLPASWGAGSAACQTPGSAELRSPGLRPSGSHSTGFVEQHCAVSINAAHFARSFSGSGAQLKGSHWKILAGLGISGPSVVYGSPGLLANSPTTTLSPRETPWLDYDFTTTGSGPATLELHLLPTFAVDSEHSQRYAVEIDGGAPIEMDLSAPPTAHKSRNAGDGPGEAGWAQNVLRNSAIDPIPLGTLAPGKHTIRLLYRDPGVVFEHLVVTFPGAPPAYPVPPETR